MAEFDNNKDTEDSEREQHPSASSHHLEVLPMNDNVQMSSQSIAPPLQQKLMPHGCGSPSWSFQPDPTGTFATHGTHSIHAFVVSTTSTNKPSIAVRVTMNHSIPVAFKHSTLGHHLFEGIDLGHEKGEFFLEQSEQDKV